MVVDYTGYKTFEINFSEGKITLIESKGDYYSDNNIESVYLIN